MNTPGSAHASQSELVRAHLQNVLESRGFFRAPRMQRFLTFIVEAELAGRADDLKETVIGTAVFDRDNAYDPKSDPVVRVEARRLRTKLDEFYQTAGKDERLRIELPKGSYAPILRWVPDPVAEIKPSVRKVTIWWLVLPTAVLGVVLGFFIHNSRMRRVVTFPGVRSLVVLPFQNLASDTSKDYLVDGFTDEITTELAKVRGLKVISRTSAQTYRATKKSLPQIAHELNIDAVVEGTVLSSGDRMRVTAQLIRAATDSHLWADTYDTSTRDLFELQGRIAQSIANQIGANVNLAPSKTEQEPAPHPEAFEDYLRGRYFWNKRSGAGLQKAIVYFQNAVERDPSYPDAYAGLGDAYAIISTYGVMPAKESIPRARAAAEKALELDPSLAEAHTVLAVIEDTYDLDWASAQREYQRAIDLKPSYSTAHLWYSRGLGTRGFFQQAIEEVQRAADLDPLSLITTTDVGEMFYWARKPQQALAPILRTLELDPTFPAAHMVLGKTYEQLHRFPEALKEFRTSYALDNNAPSQLALIGHAEALSGHRTEAREIAKQLESIARERYVGPTEIMTVYCALGDTDKAVTWFKSALDSREDELTRVLVEPLFDGCRSDARFQALLKRLPVQ